MQLRSDVLFRVKRRVERGVRSQILGVNWVKRRVERGVRSQTLAVKSSTPGVINPRALPVAASPAAPKRCPVWYRAYSVQGLAVKHGVDG